MIEPEIAELLDKVDSRFTLVMVVAKRARQLTDISKPIKDGEKTFSIELEHGKPVPTAVYEVYEDKVRYSRDEALAV